LRVVSGDPAVAALARRQHGVVTARQLFEAGLSHDAIAHRVKHHRLRRLHQGVYLVASLPAPFTPEMAAVLACGPTAVLSHRSAAALWGIAKRPDGDIDVTVVTGQRRNRPGIRVHRTRTLAPRDRTRQRGIPITTPARTLADLQPVLPTSQFDRTLEEAQVHRLVSPDDLAAQPTLHQAPTGQHEPSFTRREAERRLLELIRAAELPHPITNANLNGYEVDFLWPEQGLIVEVDSYTFHSSRQAFERDRLKDAHLQAAGYRVLRVTWRQLIHTPEALIARLACAISA
jgi:very-short-patch-repair endonuclease